MRASETQLIIEHALLSEANLELAVKIGVAYQQLRREVILRFLRLLQDEIRAHGHDDWTVDVEANESSSPFLYTRRNTWPEDINFGIGSDNGCLSWVYVWAPKFHALDNVLVDEEIEGTLNQVVGRWKTNASSRIWWHVLDRYRDWGEEENLIPLYHAAEALEYVKSLLLQVEKVVTPLIDQNLMPP